MSGHGPGTQTQTTPNDELHCQSSHINFNACTKHVGGALKLAGDSREGQSSPTGVLNILSVAGLEASGLLGNSIPNYIT